MTTTHDLFEEFKQKLHNESLSQGLSKSLDPLAHQFERRLGRALTAGERDTLVARLSTLGSHRLGDVVLDLAPDDLAAWLADPNSR